MDEETVERIRRRAYEMWQEDGRPEGQADVYWLRAEIEIAEASDDPKAKDAASELERGEAELGPDRSAGADLPTKRKTSPASVKPPFKEPNASVQPEAAREEAKTPARPTRRTKTSQAETRKSKPLSDTPGGAAKI